MTKRIALTERETQETCISAKLNLDGTGCADIQTGIGFLNHLLEALTKHARIDLTLSCTGDLEVDDHHTAEDCGIVLGCLIDEALGNRSNICRFGMAYAPLDEALARSVVDVSGRPFSDISLKLKRERIGALSCENVSHVLRSVATNARITLHVDVLKGSNDHHKAEAAFKSFALALRKAVSRSGYGDVASTKGILVSEAGRRNTTTGGDAV